MVQGIKQNIRRFIQLYSHVKMWLYTGICAILVWFYFCLPNPLFKQSYATVLLDADGDLLSARIAADEQWRFAEVDSIPYKCEQAILLFEDEYFYRHFGINPVSLYRALQQNIAHKRVISGGSTISMQVVRMACNHTSRSLFVKLYEMILALRLEIKYSKKDILRMYVSHAPFGGNVVGIDAASWRYFNRPSHMLSWSEAATLAVLPNAPALIHPNKNRHILLQKRNRLLSKLYAKGIIDSLTCSLAHEEALLSKPYPIPNAAPHLINRAIQDGLEGTIIHTSLHKQIHSYAHDVAMRYAQRYKGNHISNVAILVLHTRTGKVLGYVGNVSIPGIDNSSYVDIINAPRSSGSILKPFLYAAMLSDGLLLPHQLVADVPTSIAGYNPQNFEKTYVGAVPASQALAHSLNVPAVRMLQQFGVEKFHSLLQNLKFTTIHHHPNHYGLSLILGGAEARLWDVTSAYASMARSLMNYTQYAQYVDNEYRHASYLQNNNNQENKQFKNHSIFSAGAIYECMQTLSTLERPGSEIGWKSFTSTEKIAWKTGTSFGHRDAWSVGVTPEYTVGVWVGNASGEGRAGLTGVQYASPIMFQIFSYMQKNNWFTMPHNDMQKIPLCKQSGYRAQELCDTHSLHVPKSCLQAQSCPYHTSIFLDSTQQYRVSSSCYPVQYMKNVSWFVLPPLQEFYYKKHTPHYMVQPPLYKDCTTSSTTIMDIVVPEKHARFVIPTSTDADMPKYIFEAVHATPNTTIFWHVDGEFIAQTTTLHKIEYEPTVGNHQLLLVDEQGNMKHLPFIVVAM